MKARVYVSLKEGVLDPQGKAVGSALSSLGYPCVKEVRVGKIFEMELSDMEVSKANAQLKEMCQALLANTVVEDFKFEILKG